MKADHGGVTRSVYSADDAPHPDLVGREVCPAALVPECFLTEHVGDAEAAARAFDARLVEDLEPGQSFFVESELSYQRVATVLRHLPAGSTAAASARTPRRTSDGQTVTPAIKRSTRRRAAAGTKNSPTAGASDSDRGAAPDFAAS